LLDPTAKTDWTVIAGQSTIAGMASAAASSLETTVYTSSSTHDALGRVLTAISPDGSEVAYTYNERGALKTVDCKHRGSVTVTPVVADITYDVRGRRESISYASNATTTTYEYDPLNFRLRSIETTRASDSKKLQGLHYHYDPVGNVTDIRDDAQQTVYFQNSIVDAANSYTYDALYRLVEATGREHATQGTAQRGSSQLLPDSSAVPMNNDPNALRRYTQSYTYDAVGNLATMVHAPASGTGWTRRYQYRTDGNRLVATSAPGDSAGSLYSNTATYSHTYPHDVHGNFTAMPHMSAMEWDEADQLHHCTVGSLDVYFQYAGGVRVRKYVEHGGSTTEERIYLGPFELYRKHVSSVLKEEWESLHISDDTGRILLVETHTVDNGTPVGSPTGIWRFQLSNHLGSAATEVTETGEVISYEEYHPYGTSAYRLQNSQIAVPAKRYRYTGMERDDETALGYHMARYYVPWLGRWTAADPIGLGDGPNRYVYVTGRPIVLVDTNGMNGKIPIPGGGYINEKGDTVYSFKDEPVDGAVNEEGLHVTGFTSDNFGGGGDADLDLGDGDGSDALDDGGNFITVMREKTTAEYEAEVYREMEQQLDAEDAQHYDRPPIIDFIPLIGVRDIRHDASQLGAAIAMGDEDRAVKALKSVSVDVILTVVDVATLGADRAIVGGFKSLSRGQRGSVALAAKGGNGEIRHEAKASIRGGDSQVIATKPERAGAQVEASTSVELSDRQAKLADSTGFVVEADGSVVRAPQAYHTPPLTDQQMAEALGFWRTKYVSHGKAVFTNGDVYITRDVDAHIGGVWKMAKTPQALKSKKTRMGTYDAQLNRIGQ
jgi:RHS repeat-associated protein